MFLDSIWPLLICARIRVCMKPVWQNCKSAGINDHYSDLSEDEKCQVLLKELLEDPRILSATHAEKSELLKKN